MSTFDRESKEEFVERMKAKTKQFAIDIIRFCDRLPATQACRTIAFQLVKSASSTGANYRAACRGRSKQEFFAKLSITVEEIDKTSTGWNSLKELTSTAINKS